MKPQDYCNGRGLIRETKRIANEFRFILEMIEESRLMADGGHKIINNNRFGNACESQIEIGK